MSNEYAFTPITGQGLGTSYSSFTQIGNLLPSRDFGQAKLKCFLNVTNGNVMLQDHVVQVIDQSGPINLGFFYNSLAANPQQCWKLAGTKQFNGLPDPNNPATSVTLIEEDGHETTYQYDSQTHHYIAPGLQSGTPYLYYDFKAEQWTWYHPGTQVREYYSPSGYLQQRCDLQGRATNFKYDTQNQLEAIIAPSGTRYDIRRQGSVVGFYAGEKLLQQHTFDDLKRLQSTVPGDGHDPAYSVEYAYNGDTTQVREVKQTDGTNYIFTYDDQNRVDRFNVGNQGNTIKYNSPTSSSLIDSREIKTDFIVDSNSRLTQLIQQRGYESYINPPDITNYDYAVSGQLKSIEAPDGSSEVFEFNHPLGLETKHILGNGQATEFYYDPTDLNRPKLSNKVQYASKVINPPRLITSYTYSSVVDEQNKEYSFLRFEISPEGRVTEYTSDVRTQNPSLVRKYCNQTYAAERDEKIAPSLEEMENWAKQANPQQVSLTKFLYNDHGQAQQIVQYANISEQGEGIDDAQKSQTNYVWDIFGGWTSKQVIQKGTSTNSVKLRTTQQFDTLHRLKQKTEFMGSDSDNNNVPEKVRQTKHIYNDKQAQVTTVHPNEKVDIKQLDKQGQLTNTQEQVGLETRTTQFKRDSGGRIVETIHPDKQITYTMYDKQQRLGYVVDVNGIWDEDPFNRKGIVTQFDYDRVHRYKKTTRYAGTINIKEWVTNPQKLPEVGALTPLLKNIQNKDRDRATYEFYDASNLLQYQVDEEQYVTEFKYNHLNQLIGRITYKTPLTDAELTDLTQGRTITKIPDAKVDRWTQFFYDKDGNKIGEQDPAGYITEWKLDQAGRPIEKIIYFNPSAHEGSFAACKPMPDPERDAHTHYLLNARGLVVGEIDAEGFYTANEYFACGLIAKSRRYLNKPEPPNPPQPSSEDLITVFQYDLLNRLTTTTQQAEIGGDINNTVNLKKDVVTYDIMDHIIGKQTSDLQNTTPSSDHQRGVQSEYDGWGQVIKEVNPFIMQVLTDIDNNPDLTREQKIAKKNDVLQNQSTRNRFDVTGLKLSSTDSLNQTTLYFYDSARRPLITIDPKGIITELTLDNFGNPTEIRHYYNKIPAEKLKNLSGGFINQTIRDLLNGLKNPGKDSAHLFERNRRGLVWQKIDPEGYFSFFKYNAFKQCELEELAVADLQPTLKIAHEFETRGLEVKTTKTAGDLTTEETHEYQHPLGKETAVINAVQARIDKGHDRLGNLNKTEQSVEGPIKAVQTAVHDAFNRVERETDSLNQTTVHQYNQVERTHTITPPIANAQECLTKNVFKENVKHTDGEGNSKTWQHSPVGAVQKSTDAVGNTTIDEFDNIGQHRLHKHANGSIDVLQHDASGFLVKKIQDADPQTQLPSSAHLHLKTEFIRSALGDAEDVIDPKSVHHVAEFDRRHLQTKTIVDPGNGKPTLVTQQKYNGQKQQISSSQGDVNDQFDETVQIDGLGRQTGTTIDPNGEGISQTQQLDKAGRVIAKEDPNGNIAYLFYDDLDKLRFAVNAAGGIKEWRYNTEGKEISHREFANSIDVKQLKDKTLAQMVALAKTVQSSQDSVLYLFYDENKREKFRVNSLGAVRETSYNKASKTVASILYNLPINVAKLTDATTAVDMASCVSEDPMDRRTYYVLDANGQQRFIIDPKGYVTEQCFDSNKNVIIKKIYDIPVDNPAEVAKLTPDQVYAKIKLNPERDRTNYFVFDARNKPLYSVNGEGIVTGFEHDQNGNLISECLFDDNITPPENYQALVVLLETLKPDPTKDHITSFNVDNVNRLISETNALQLTDKYDLDAGGNTQSHIDKGGNKWIYQYDGAKRRTDEYTPATNVTTISYNADTQKLTASSPEKMSVQKHIEYDNDSNKTSVIEGSNLPVKDDVRSFNAQYNACNNIQATTTPQVAVNNPDQKADFNNRPELIQDVTTQIVYDGKQLEIGHKNEAGQWSYKVYDSEKRLRYQIDPSGAVIKTEYNPFGEEIKEIKFANTIEVKNLYPYIEQGIAIPPEIIDQAVKDDPNNRTKISIRDLRGDIECELKGPVFCYTPNPETKQPSYDVAYATTKREFNAARELIRERKLINSKLDKWSETINWRDRNGVIVAQAKNVSQLDDMIPTYAVQRDLLNAFGKPTSHTEYATPIAGLSSETSLAELDILLNQNQSAKDRKKTYEYDLLGQLLSESHINAIIQRIVMNDGAPTMINITMPELTRSYTYGPIKCEGPLSITYEDGQTAYFYYDERGLKIAEKGVPRTSEDVNGQPITIVPLTIFQRNAFGQQCVVTRYKQGTVYINFAAIIPNKTDLKPNGYVLFNNGEHWQLIYIDSQKQQQKVQISEIKELAEILNNKKSVNDLSLTDRANIDRIITFYHSGTNTPLPIANDLEDQTSYTQFDKRGLPKNLQDAETNLTARTFTATKRAAREWYYLTNPQPGKSPIVNIDEKRFGYDVNDAPYLLQILRNDAVWQTTQSNLNTFGEVVGEGPGDDTFPAEQRFDGLGQVWFDNFQRGAPRIIVRDLQGKETGVFVSAPNDLTSINYDDLSSLLNDPYWDIEHLERTETYRDCAERVRAKMMPAYEDSGQNQLRTIPLAMATGNTSSEFGSTSISWVLPQEANVQPQFLIWPKANKNAVHDVTSYIKVIDGRCGIDVSYQNLNLPSDVYEYEIKYSLTDPTNKNLPPIQLYQTTGTLQFDNKNNQGSLLMVTTVVQNNQLYLTGNTAGLQKVKVYQNGEWITDVVVHEDQNSSNYIADLQNLPSGQYTIKPIVNGQTLDQMSLPFTIYTPISASQPLSREIPCKVDFAITNQTTGVVTWDLPADFANTPVKVICRYIGTDNVAHTVTFLMDQNGGQIEFPVPIVNILSLSFAVQTPEKEWLPLMVAQPPEQTSPLQKKQFLQTKSPNHSGFSYFEPVISANKQDVGFVALGTTRHDFVAKMRSLKNDLTAYTQACVRLASEIQRAFITKALTPPDDNWKLFTAKLGEVIKKLCLFLQKIRYESKDAKIKKLSDRELIQWLEKEGSEKDVKILLNLQIEQGEAEQKLADYCAKSEVFDYYLSALQKNLPLGYDSTLLYAELNNLNVNVWQQDPHNPFHVQISKQQLSKEGQPQIHLMPIGQSTQVAFLTPIDFNQTKNLVPTKQVAKHKKAEVVLETADDFVMIKDELEEEWEDLSDNNNVVDLDNNNTQVKVDNYSFGPTLSLYITPLFNSDNETSLQYLDTSLDIMAKPKLLNLNGSTSKGVVADITTLAPGVYPYKFHGTSGFSFAVTHGEGIYCSDDFPTLDRKFNTTPKTKINSDDIWYPTHYFEPDVWGNNVSYKDSLGFETTCEYNENNQPIKQTKPPVDVVNEDGSVTPDVKPVTLQGYNECRVQIGTTDQNNNTKANKLDEAGQTIQTILGDGTIVRTQVWDALSRVVAYYNAANNKWLQSFDHLNHLTTYITPMNRQTTYWYNEKGKQALVTAPFQQIFVTTFYNFDPNLNISDYYLPEGQTVHMEWDRNRQLTLKTGYDGGELTWNRDYFGVPVDDKKGVGHKDLSGTEYLSVYDFKKQPILEYSQGANHGNYVELVPWVNPWWHHFDHKHPSVYYQPAVLPSPNKSLNMTYRVGRVVQVRDNALGNITTMDYDPEGRPNYRQLMLQDGTVVRTIKSILDSQGRSSWSFDTQMVMLTGYDGVGNRRHVTATVYTDFNTTLSFEQWNTFDKANNVLIEGGRLASNVITILGQGFQYHYSNGFRDVQTVQDSSGAITTTNIKYDNDGMLTNTNSSNNDSSVRVWDSSGTLTYYQDTQYALSQGFNRNKWLNTQSQKQLSSQDGPTQTTFSFFNSQGMPGFQETTYNTHDSKNNPVTIWDLLYMYYAGYESWQLTKVGGFRIDPWGTGQYSAAVETFGPNAAVNSVLNSQQELNPLVPNPALIYDQSSFDSLILEKQYLSYDRGYRFIPGGLYEKAHIRYFYTVEDQYIANYTIPLEAPPSAYIGYRHFFQNSISGSYEVGFDPRNQSYMASGQAGTLEFADVTEPYTGSSGQELQIYPPQIGGTQVAATGDSFASVSQRASNSPNYAQEIAEASRLSADEPLYEGRQLTIPTLLPNQNNANSFVPLEQIIAKIMGTLYPNLQTVQPPPPKQHHSFWHELVDVFVQVISVVIGVAVSAAFPGIGILVAAAVASVADAAGQLIEEKLGFRDKFSLAEVLDTGISAAFAGWNPTGTLGIGNAIEETAKMTATKAMLLAGSEAVTEQLANIAIGEAHKFDIKEVLVSMLTAGASAKLPSNLISKTLLTIASNAATQEIETHHLDMETLAAEALGTTLAQAVSGTIANETYKLSMELKTYAEAQWNSVTTSQQSNAQPDIQQTNTDTNRNNQNTQNTADSPSNRYTKSQTNDTNTATTSTDQQDNSNTTNANAAKASRWNQDTQQSGSWGAKQMEKQMEQLLSPRSWQDQAKAESALQLLKSLNDPQFTTDDSALSKSQFVMDLLDLGKQISDFYGIKTPGIFKLAGRLSSIITIGKGTDEIINKDYGKAYTDAADVVLGTAAGLFFGPVGAAIYLAFDKLIGLDNIETAVQAAYQVDEDQLNINLENMGYQGPKF